MYLANMKNQTNKHIRLYCFRKFYQEKFEYKKRIDTTKKAIMIRYASTENGNSEIKENSQEYSGREGAGLFVKKTILNILYIQKCSF